MKHTKGPWKHVAGGEIWSDHRLITIGRGVYGVKGAAERNANARLIAAAPDLLVALQAFVDDMGGRFGEIPDDCAAYHAAKQAIADAT